MDSNECLVEDEINLRDYINVILKYKRLIITIFLISTFVTAVLSSLKPKVYQATTLVMITPSKIRIALASSGGLFYAGEVEVEAEGGANFNPMVSLSTHEELLRSNEVLQKVISKVSLVDSFGKEITPYALSKKVEIERVENTNIIRLLVKDNSPKEAKKIADVWAREYIEYSQKLISEEIKGTGSFIADQFDIAKQSLMQAEEEIKDFKNNYKLDLMKAELEIKKGKINGERKELINSDLALKTKQITLKELKKEIEGEDEFIIISKAITDEALWQQTLKGKDASSLENKKLKSEMVNPIYQNLKERIVNLNIETNVLNSKIEYLETSIKQTNEEIGSLEKATNQRQFELTQLKRQMDIYEKAYNSLSSKIEEVRIIEAAQLDEVKIVSSAMEPSSAVAPKKKQMVAIAGIASIMFAVFLVFFIEFMRTSKPSDKSKD